MTKKKNPERVRFAPSPTGHLHLGGARTALYDYLIARQTGGQFILRIEDTDRKRYVEGAEQEIKDGLHWLGMDWDEGPDLGGPHAPYRQSQRKHIYQEYGEKLVESDHAFYCFCTPERLAQVRKEQQARRESPHYDGTCRELSLQELRKRIAEGERYVVRFRSPQEGTTTVTDLLRGEITIENKNLDDFILIKSDGWALYHLAAVVDDHLMGISHVIRGSEWLPTFPLHALIHRAYGWQEPVWVHLSVFLKPSGKGKMSKREAADLSKDGYSIFLKDLENLGYLPEAVVNWIALIGWSYDDRTEFFSMPDLIAKFSLERLNPSPAAINFSKLDHFNRAHIKALSPTELAERVQPFFVQRGIAADMQKLVEIAPIINERITTLDEAVDMAGFFFNEKIDYEDTNNLIIGSKGPAGTIQVAQELKNDLSNIGAADAWSAQAIETPMKAWLQRNDLTPREGYGFMREVLANQRVSPPLFETMQILGKNETLKRIDGALEMLKNTSEK